MTFLTLTEAAKFIPGADANTLKRMHRAGKLTCYRPGKAFLTTQADVMEAVTKQCRAVPKVRDSGCTRQDTMPPETSRMPQLGLSSTELAGAALDSVLTQALTKKKKR